jgi:hypothetical protein
MRANKLFDLGGKVARGHTAGATNSAHSLASSDSPVGQHLYAPRGDYTTA